MAEVEGRCMKCREQRKIEGAYQDKMKNGRDCIKGKCGVCNTSMFKIGKLDNA